ncbi:RNA polymerase sigma factor [Maribellus maritimus]|uniref:RNA polymerase sigma factor n=1 Tax=Maribellus maritimus TaxID=2870838 RepID=UPI001EEC3F12|nr:sigma-70 family RNA polymerase sigma factor [Maribellus maritimus]MCG6190112.1 sigma-70 family RNA polymerase sigma factor [Maribellus maritimus]
MKSIKENILWDSFRQGNKDALEIIYEENYSALYYYGLKFIKDRDTVKDNIQELFLELIKSGDRLAKTDNIRYYLLRALRYKLTRKTPVKLIGETEVQKNIEFSLIESVEHQLITKEVEEGSKKKIINAIGKLSEKQQEIIYLRFYNNLSYQQIAEVYGTKMQTVRNLMSRALHSLKEDFRNNRDQLLLFLLPIPQP